MSAVGMLALARSGVPEQHVERVFGNEQRVLVSLPTLSENQTLIGSKAKANLSPLAESHQQTIIMGIVM